jgi:hypothetical protein
MQTRKLVFIGLISGAALLIIGFIWLQIYLIQSLGAVYYLLGWFFSFNLGEFLNLLKRDRAYSIRGAFLILYAGLCWMDWYHIQAFVLLNGLVLGLNVWVRQDLYLYYLLVRKQSINFGMWFGLESKRIDREWEWVLIDLVKRAEWDLLKEFLREYYSQFTLAYYYVRRDQRTNLEPFVWKLLENPKISPELLPIPSEMVIHLVLEPDWLEIFVQKAQHSPHLTTRLEDFLEIWVQHMDNFVESPQDGGQWKWYFSTPALEQRINIFLEHLVPQLPNNQVLRDKFQYACSLSFVGIGMAANMD